MLMCSKEIKIFKTEPFKTSVIQFVDNEKLATSLLFMDDIYFQFNCSNLDANQETYQRTRAYDNMYMNE